MQYRVGIDQLKIGMTITDEERRLSVEENAFTNYNSFIGAMEYVGSVRSKMVFDAVPGQNVVFKVGKKPAAWTLARQPLPLGGDIEVRYARHVGAYRLWVRMNPSKSDVGELHLHLRQMLADGFETLYRYGRVTYCEFFIDVEDVSFDDYVYLDTKLRSSHDGYDEAGTTYLGSAKSHRSFAIYDKAKQLSDTAGIVLPQPRLRLEARLRGAYGFAVPLLPDVHNPFAHLVVISKRALRACSEASARSLLTLMEQGMSVQAAYRRLGPQGRCQFNKVLPDLVPGWWRPQLMWENYPHGLGWIDTLRHAGRYGDNLLFGEPVPYSGALLPVFTVASAALDMSPCAIDCAVVGLPQRDVNGQSVNVERNDAQPACAKPDDAASAHHR